MADLDMALESCPLQDRALLLEAAAQMGLTDVARANNQNLCHALRMAMVEQQNNQLADQLVAARRQYSDVLTWLMDEAEGQSKRLRKAQWMEMKALMDLGAVDHYGRPLPEEPRRGRPRGSTNKPKKKGRPGKRTR